MKWPKSKEKIADPYAAIGKNIWHVLKFNIPHNSKKFQTCYVRVTAQLKSIYTRGSEFRDILVRNKFKIIYHQFFERFRSVKIVLHEMHHGAQRKL